MLLKKWIWFFAIFVLAYAIRSSFDTVGIIKTGKEYSIYITSKSKTVTIFVRDKITKYQIEIEGTR